MTRTCTCIYGQETTLVTVASDLTRHYIWLISTVYACPPKLIMVYRILHATDKLGLACCQHHITADLIWHGPCMLSCQNWQRHMAPDMQLMTLNANADEALKGGKCWSEFIHKLSIDIPTWKGLDRVCCGTWSVSVRPYNALWCHQASKYLIG